VWCAGEEEKAMKKLIWLLALLTFAIPALGWSAQATQAPTKIQEQPPAEAPGFKTVEGALSRIESAQQLLWIKAADGKEIEFKYSTQTQVTGGDNGVEGLANASGTYLKILYEIVDGVNNAVKIDILQA
jgi:hypothetical protein